MITTLQRLRLFRCRASTMVRTRVGAHHRLITAIARASADPQNKSR